MRVGGDPQPLDYLASTLPDAAFDITLEVLIETPGLKAQGQPPHLLARSNARHLYWTVGQMITHHACGGCNLEPGDLDAVMKNAALTSTSAPKGTVYYISLNTKNANLAKPEVQEAFKYLIDYDAIGKTLIKGIGEIRQTFEPKGVQNSSWIQPPRPFTAIEK